MGAVRGAIRGAVPRNAYPSCAGGPPRTLSRRHGGASRTFSRVASLRRGAARLPSSCECHPGPGRYQCVRAAPLASPPRRAVPPADTDRTAHHHRRRPPAGVAGRHLGPSRLPSRPRRSRRGRRLCDNRFGAVRRHEATHDQVPTRRCPSPTWQAPRRPKPSGCGRADPLRLAFATRVTCANGARGCRTSLSRTELPGRGADRQHRCDDRSRVSRFPGRGRVSGRPSPRDIRGLPKRHRAAGVARRPRLGCRLRHSRRLPPCCRHPRPQRAAPLAQPVSIRRCAPAECASAECADNLRTRPLLTDYRRTRRLGAGGVRRWRRVRGRGRGRRRWPG